MERLAAEWELAAGDHCDVLGAQDLPALAAAALAGGKRLRPEMVHWGWAAAGAPVDTAEQVVDLGAALELLHVFALVQDDVMDASELRRGRPAVHALARDRHRTVGAIGRAEDFGASIAVLVGDLLHAEADHLVSGLPRPTREVWRTMVIELVAGQRRDLTGAAVGRRDLLQAREVARLKSGSYTVQRPLQMGALLGGASPRQVEALLVFGGHAGEAFGLRDDILGTWGDPSRTGKSDLDDFTAGKATVLLALAVERLSEHGRFLLRLAGSGLLEPPQMEELRTEMDACGIREDAEAMVEREVRSASDALLGSGLTDAAVEGLLSALHRMAWRES